MGARVYGEQTVCVASGSPCHPPQLSLLSPPPHAAGPAFLPLGLLSPNHRTLSDSDTSTWPPRAQRRTHQVVVVTILRGRHGYCPHRMAEETTAPAGGGAGWGRWAVSGGPRCWAGQTSAVSSRPRCPFVPQPAGRTWSAFYLGHHLEQPWPSIALGMGPALTAGHVTAQGERPRAWTLSCHLVSSTPAPSRPVFSPVRPSPASQE